MMAALSGRYHHRTNQNNTSKPHRGDINGMKKTFQSVQILLPSDHTWEMSNLKMVQKKASTQNQNSNPETPIKFLPLNKATTIFVNNTCLT